MQLDRSSFIIFLLMAFFIIVPVNALNLGVHSDVGSVTKDIAAGDQTTYSGKTVVGQEAILDSWEASGSDEKSIKSRVSSGSNANSISLDSSGPMSASVTSTASSDAVISCLDGKMAGDTALLKMASESKGNDQYLTAGFSGEVSEDTEGLDASLTMVAAGSSGIDGDLTLLGVDGLGDGVQGDMAMVLNGLYAKPDGGLGEFGATMLNVDKSKDNDKSGRLYETIQPGTYRNWNDPNAYVLAGWRWRDSDLGTTKTQLILLNDRTLSDECSESEPNGLTVESANAVITAAANTWDTEVTSKNLFPDTDTVLTVDGTISGIIPDTNDGKNVHAWTDMSGALAYSRTWITKAKTEKAANGINYKRALESDVCYNKNLRWTTNFYDTRLYHWDTTTQRYVGDTFYLETVAAHELGHTLGLGDTYLHRIYKYDQAQIMGSYNDVNDLDGSYDGNVHLGEGDKTGIHKLYGA